MDPLRWIDPPHGPAIALLDQTRLPAEEVTLLCGDVPSLVAAIQSLAVRGAPLLGIAGGYGVALAAAIGADVPTAAEELANARPTAVNLAWAARRVLAAYTAARTDAEACTGSAASAGAGAGAEARADADLRTGAESRVDTAAGTGPAARTEADVRTDRAACTDTEARTDADVRTGAASRADTVAGTGPAARSGAGGRPGVDARARDRALAEAHAIAAEEAEASARMGEHGLTLVPENARVLTHCNAGALAAGGEGTSLAVVVAAHRAGRLKHLWVDETRPLLQGARLTAYEARRHGIPYAVLPDNAAGSLFAAGEVDLVVVGADRIARDHSVANKVGTYPLAVLARHHGVPFVVVAPTSTFDPDARTGADIPIEQRDASEVTTFAGKAIAPEGSPAYNPAFDVTPGDLVTAIVTERGVIITSERG